MGARAAIDLFGPFVEAPPRDIGGTSERTVRSGGATHGPDDLRLETGIVSAPAAGGFRHWLTASCSVVAHSVGLVATIAVPLLLSSALPEPAGGVRAFLVEPLVVAPPPPPPPPAPRSVVTRARPMEVPAPTNTLVAPLEIPAELRPAAGLDLGVEGGVDGGVEGGVPGGVVGGIVGGLPESLAQAPPPVTPLRVSGTIKEPAKLKHVTPVYPAVAAAGRVEGRVVMEALVDVRGHVAEVRVLEGHPLFDDAALEAVRQWIYTPTLLDGVPVPLLVTVTVRFQLAGSR